MPPRRSNRVAVAAPSPPPARDTALDGAARRVYDSPDLWHYILKLVDRTTLARALRLEKVVTASVAGVLYRKVNGSVMSGMTPSVPRRAVYCQAVRVLDTSPRANADDPLRYGSFKPPIHLDPGTLLGNIAVYRKKFPNLQTILHLYPRQFSDDAYTVHIDGADITIDLETAVGYERYFYPTTSSPILPSPPALIVPAPPAGSLTIRQTFMLNLANQTFRSNMTDAEMHQSSQDWSKYLYRNPDLDGRVIGINHNLYDMVDPSLEQFIEFLQSRQNDGCHPLLSCQLSAAKDITLDSFSRISVGLGPGLRSLHVVAELFESFPEIQTAVEILDKALPRLEEFTILFGHNSTHYLIRPPSRSLVDAKPLSGMPYLLRFNIMRPRNVTPDLIASYVYQLGSDDCTYHFDGMPSNQSMKEFNLRVRQMRVDERKKSVCPIL